MSICNVLISNIGCDKRAFFMCGYFHQIILNIEIVNKYGILVNKKVSISNLADGLFC
jgi:hypothetical protein